MKLISYKASDLWLESEKICDRSINLFQGNCLYILINIETNIGILMLTYL